MSIKLYEFLEVYQTEDILDWWTNEQLPYPGCPVGFKLVQQLVLACHKLPWGHDKVRKRYEAIKETRGVVSFEALIDTNFIFGWNGMNRKLMVPVSDDYDVQTDRQLLYIIYP